MMPNVSPRNRPVMNPHMVRCTDEEWDALTRATEIRGEFVSEATRRLWAEYVRETNEGQGAQR
jgi:hypothetical protein